MFYRIFDKIFDRIIDLFEKPEVMQHILECLAALIKTFGMLLFAIFISIVIAQVYHIFISKIFHKKDIKSDKIKKAL